MLKKYCPYCLPAKRKIHIHFHIVYYLKNIGRIIGFGSVLKLKKQSRFNADMFWPLMLRILVLLKIAKSEKNPDKSKLFNRSLIFFDEAKKRGIDIAAIKVFGRYRNDFRFQHNKKRYYYESIPLFSRNISPDIDNKQKVKLLLLSNNIPVPKGGLFTKKQNALKFTRQIGWPVVVKPCSGSLSQHVICNISSEQELLSAIKAVKIYRPDFVLEKHAHGNLYRATVVGQKNVFCCLKERANVVGNGKSTIIELINEKNKNKKRGEANQKNTTLHKIVVNDTLRQILNEQGFSINTVLAANKKAYLHNKYTLSAGCDIIGLTDKAHPDNKALFLKVAQILKTRLVGIDVICPDIAKSYKVQEFAVLETNSLPYIDMHQEASHGVPDNAAKIVWDIVLNNIK